jgi:hypothetical protein
MVLLACRMTAVAAAGGRAIPQAAPFQKAMNLGSAGTLVKLALTHLLECASNGGWGGRDTNIGSVGKLDGRGS